MLNKYAKIINDPTASKEEKELARAKFRQLTKRKCDKGHKYRELHGKWVCDLCLIELHD